MISRTILVSTLLILALTGFIKAATDHHWWRTKQSAGDGLPQLPAAKDEFARILKKYAGTDSVTDLSGIIHLYDGETSMLKETNSFRCYRSGGKYFWQLSYLQTFCDGKILLQLDTLHKEITVSKNIPAGNGVGFPGQMPAALFNDSAVVHLTGTVEPMGGQRELVLHSDFQPAIRECRLFYDTLDYRIKKEEIEYWKGVVTSGSDANQKIWLAKVDFDYKPGLDPGISQSIASMIRIDNGQVKGIGRYQDYQVNVNF